MEMTKFVEPVENYIKLNVNYKRFLKIFNILKGEITQYGLWYFI